MKNILNKLFSLLALVVIGVSCTTVDIDYQDPVSSGSLVINQQDIEFYGTLRESTDVEGCYIEIPYTLSTGARLEVTAKDIPSGLTLDSQVQVPISSEGGTFKIYIYGTPLVYGNDVPFKFTVGNDDFTELVQTSTKIYSNGEGLDNLVYRSMDLNFDSMYRFTQTEGEITISYYNACGRSVKLSLVSEYFSFADGDEHYTLLLPNDSEVGEITVPVVGYCDKTYDGVTSTSLELVLTYVDSNNYTQTSSRSDVVTILSNDFEIVSDSIDTDIAYGVSVDGANLVLNYINGECRELTFELTSVGNLGVTLNSTPKTVVLNAGEGSVTLPLGEGEPVEGTLIVEVKITGDEYFTDTDYTTQTYYLIDSITITNAVFKAPIIEGYDDTQDFYLEISYTGGYVGSYMKLAGVSGMEAYLGFDADKLSSITADLVETDEGTIVFDISDLIIDGELTDNNTYPYTTQFTVSVINASGTENKATFTDDVTLKGFIWEGFHYNVVSVGGEYWLDRNMRAKTNIAGETTQTAAGTLTWNTIVPSMYGAYYQWGRSTGIDMVNTDECVAVPFLSTGTSDDFWADGLWSVPSSDVTPTAPMSLLSSTYVSTMEAAWNSTDGGSANPCPPGFRVPTLSEITTMLNNYLTNVSDTYVAYPYTLITGDMALPPSGYIHSNGPTGREVSSTTTIGERNMAGYYFTSVTPTASSSGYVCLMSCDYLEHSSITANSTFIKYIQVTNAGVISEMTSTRTTAMPIRAIKK